MAGIILSNVLPYLEVVYTLPSLWRQNQYDCVSVDASGEAGEDGGESPAERGREQAEVISVNPLSDASLLLLKKRESKVIWCTEILRPYSTI